MSIVSDDIECIVVFPMSLIIWDNIGENLEIKRMPLMKSRSSSIEATVILIVTNNLN